MSRLFTYKMTSDTGFAPNPFWGILTVATCKPGIRKTKNVSDWIAGFTSKCLCRDPVGAERLVYLMQVCDKRTIGEYFRDPTFARKIPDRNKAQCVYGRGDNIYRPLCQNPVTAVDFEQLPNPHHPLKHKNDDLKGIYVLLAGTFFYFGGTPLTVPESIRPNIPPNQTYYGRKTTSVAAEKFIDWVKSEASQLKPYSHGIYGGPYKWPTGDQSWAIVP